LEDQYLLNDTLGMLALAYLQLDERYTARSLLDQMVLQKQEVRSYESVFQQLVYGTILLAEQCYDKAEKTLQQVAHLTSESGVQWLQVQALLRLAACRLAQGQLGLMRDALQQVLLLNAQGNHDFCIQGELQSYPLLQPFLQEKSEQKAYLETSVLPTERLCIHALGEPVILLDGNVVTGWRRARALELFFFLLESKQPLRKGRIISTLWPESDDDEILNQTFRSTVYCVRQVLGEACLVYQSGLYQFNLHAVYHQFWYDVAAFEEHERIAKIALEKEDDQQAEQAYKKMVELYRGKYAEAFYSDWCSARRDALHQSMMEARRQLALIAWRREEWEESLQHWQHLLTLDSRLETAHYGIMRCYSRQGKRELAMRQYQRCRRELYEQLGTEPGSSLQKFYQRLVNPGLK
jgi:two-component SAPR family response regulator